MGLGIEEEPVWCPPTMEHSVSEKNRFTEGKKGKHKTQYPGRWYAVVANPSGQEMGGVGGGQGAWEPVNWDWKGKLWLCRRGRLKGQWWFGSGQWGGELKSWVGWSRRLSRR